MERTSLPPPPPPPGAREYVNDIAMLLQQQNELPKGELLQQLNSPMTLIHNYYAANKTLAAIAERDMSKLANELQRDLDEVQLLRNEVQRLEAELAGAAVGAGAPITTERVNSQ